MYIMSSVWFYRKVDGCGYIYHVMWVESADAGADWELHYDGRVLHEGNGHQGKFIYKLVY